MMKCLSVSGSALCAWKKIGFHIYIKIAATAPLFQPENSLNGLFCQGKKFSLFFKTIPYKNVDFSGQGSKCNKKPKPQMSHENNYSFCENT